MGGSAAATMSVPQAPIRAAELEITDRGGDTRVVAIAARRVVLGRGKDVAVWLDDDTVSRHHAELVCDPFGRWWVRDLGSRNGTKIAGQAITQEVIVNEGEEFQLGVFRLKLHCKADVAHEPAPVAAVIDDDGTTVVRIISGKGPPSVNGAQLAALLDLGQQLSGTETTAERGQLLCEAMVAETFRGAWAAMLRVDLRTPEMVTYVARRAASAMGRDASGHVSRSLLRRAVETRQAALGSNVARGVDVQISVDAMVAALSAIAVPIRFAPESAELLYVAVPPECCSAEWVALAALAVGQYQQAETTAASRERERLRAELERDIERARVIQQRLIPQRPRVPGLDIALSWLPCKWVGGDYADVILAEDGRVTLVVADVCGKGFQGAMVVSSLHTLIRSAVRAGVGLGRVMALANEHLCDYLPEGSFVTLLALTLSAEAREGEYVNAGHPPGIVVSPEGHVTELEGGRNAPLGIERQELALGNFRLGPGHTLAMCTDGWTELADAGGNLLGIKRVNEAIRAACQRSGQGPLQETIEQIVQTLDSHRGRCLAGDDRTLLLARPA